MDKISNCRTRLLSDVPEAEDYFGTHKRLACAIRDLIVTETGGRSLALEGSYGSGKTTVINLLRSELAKNKNYTLVPFDAWAHEKDPLRRTFLETLIKHFCRLGWVDESNWKKRLDEIAQRREVKTTRSTPELTLLGKLTGLYLFLIPVGVAVLNAGLKGNDVILKWGAPIAWKVVIGSLLSLAPLIAILLGLLVSYARRIEYGGQWWRPFRVSAGSKDASRIWALLFNKIITEEQTETSKTPNPTSIEFEEAFSVLMDEGLRQAERRAVIVLDNLDRVDADDALSVWSTLQTFLSSSHYERPPWFERLWIIVLYDPSGISRLWERNGNDKGISGAFLQKSFQLTFRVPSPLRSDWRAYLVNLLKQALPEHSTDEFYAVSHILNLTRDLTPTIRELKLYVNQIGSIHRQWQDTYPLSHIAFYVARVGQTDVTISLLDSEFPEERVRGVLGIDSEDRLSEFRNNIAALYFNTDVKAAKQLLLRGPIEKALFGGYGDAESLADIAKSNQGALEVLEGMLMENPFGARGDLLAVAANTLEASGIIARSESPAARSIKSAICRLAAKGNHMWPHIVPQSAKGIGAILRWKGDANFATEFLKSITSQIVSTGESDERVITVIAWIEPLKTLAKELASSGMKSAFDDGMIKPLADVLRAPDVRTAVAVAETLELLSGLRGPQTTAEGALAELVEGGHVLHQLGGLWHQTLRRAAESAHEVRRENTPAPAARPDESLVNVTAWCMYAFLRYAPRADRPPDVGFSLQGYAQITDVLQGEGGFYDFKDKFLSVLRRFKELGLLPEVFENAPVSRPFIGSCLRTLPEKEYGRLKITPGYLIANWRLLYEELRKEDAFSTKFGRLIRVMIHRGLIPYLVATDFTPSDAKLYVEVLIGGATKDERFRDWCQDGLRKIREDVWEQQLYDKGDLSTLAVLFATFTDMGIELDHNYMSALKSHAQKITDRRVEEVPRANLAAPLGEGSLRHQFRRELLDLAVRASSSLPDYFFHLFRDELFDAEILEKNSSLVTQLLLPIIDRGNLAAVRWIADLLQKYPAFLDSFPEREVAEFKEAVRRVVQKGVSYASSRSARDIADVLNIDYLEVMTDEEKKKRWEIPYESSPSIPREEREFDEMWQVFHGLGQHFTVGLIDTSGEPQVMCFGVGANGESVYYEPLSAVRALKSKGIVRGSKKQPSGMIKEYYELTDKGRRLFDETEFLPEGERYDAGITRLKNA